MFVQKKIVTTDHLAKEGLELTWTNINKQKNHANIVENSLEERILKHMIYISWKSSLIIWGLNLIGKDMALQTILKVIKTSEYVLQYAIASTRQSYALNYNLTSGSLTNKG